MTAALTSFASPVALGFDASMSFPARAALHGLPALVAPDLEAASILSEPSATWALGHALQRALPDLEVRQRTIPGSGAHPEGLQVVIRRGVAGVCDLSNEVENGVILTVMPAQAGFDDLPSHERRIALEILAAQVVTRIDGLDCDFGVSTRMIGSRRRAVAVDVVLARSPDPLRFVPGVDGRPIAVEIRFDAEPVGLIVPDHRG